MNKVNEKIPKRVLSGVQRNVAILVDLLKAEGITPEVDSSGASHVFVVRDFVSLADRGVRT